MEGQHTGLSITFGPRQVDCLLLPYVLARPEAAGFAAEWLG